jgi:RNA polymerase sigma-70 factor (ECF subfamily)
MPAGRVRRQFQTHEAADLFPRGRGGIKWGPERLDDHHVPAVSGGDLLSHLDAAYNLARWLMGNPADAEDVVQEAYVRALAGVEQFRGGDPRAWLLSIVRNACHSSHRRQRVRQVTDFEETVHGEDTVTPSPEQVAINRDTSRRVRLAIERLSPEFQEVIVLREFEGLSYKEIAEVVAAPVGTVMSRLSRARAQLAAVLAEERA